MTQILFDPIEHKYTNSLGERYLSVTQLVELFIPKFDEQFWLAYKALQSQLGFDNTEQGKKAYKKVLFQNGWKFEDWGDKNVEKLHYIASLEGININTKPTKKQWKDINEEALAKGTRFHNETEAIQLEKQKTEFIKKGNEVRVITDFDGDIAKVKENGVIPEMRLYNHQYKIAGTTDQPYFELPYFDINDWKGLALDTPMLTSTGWKTMGDLQRGDYIYSGEGKLTKILNVSEIHYNPCYKLTFTGIFGDLTADHEHKWVINLPKLEEKVVTTEELFTLFSTGVPIRIHRKSINNEKVRITNYLKSIEKVDTVPTKCLEVESPCHTYLAGKGLIKTHNTNKEIKYENKYSNMLYCLSHLQDCNFNHYNIQLSLYAWMLEQYGYKTRNIGITHILFNNLGEAQYTYYIPMKYLKKEIEEMLEYYDKNLRKNAFSH